jgi:hypothetical protein
MEQGLVRYKQAGSRIANDELNEILFRSEEPTHWANVVLPLALPQVYTYSLPDHLVERAFPGCRVEVVFVKTKNMRVS